MAEQIDQFRPQRYWPFSRADARLTNNDLSERVNLSALANVRGRRQRGGRA